MKIEKKVVAIALISSFLILISLFSSPKVREFDINNKSILKEFKLKETFSIIFVTIVSILSPFCVYFYYFRTMLSLDIEKEIQFYILFLTNFLVVSAIIENLKNVIGRLRPDFIGRCIPIDGICTGKLGTIKEGRKSFPSGHTGTATAGFLFLIIFLNDFYDKLRRNMFYSKLIRTFLILIIPLIVGYSRFYDNRHFASDIFSGGLIAFGATLVLYKYFGYQILQINETDTSK